MKRLVTYKLSDGTDVFVEVDVSEVTGATPQ